MICTLPSCVLTSRRSGEAALLPELRGVPRAGSASAAASSPSIFACPPSRRPPCVADAEDAAVSPTVRAESKSGSLLPDLPGTAELVSEGSCCKQWCELQSAFPIVSAGTEDVEVVLVSAARSSTVSAAGQFVSVLVWKRSSFVFSAGSPSELFTICSFSPPSLWAASCGC